MTKLLVCINPALVAGFFYVRFWPFADGRSVAK